jgi:ribonuclease VapC
MIAVDTSALVAIVLNEPDADACAEALGTEDHILISAGTVAEALIVAGRRNVGEEVVQLMDGLGFEIVSVTPAATRRIAEAYENGEGAFTPQR